MTEITTRRVACSAPRPWETHACFFLLYKAGQSHIRVSRRDLGGFWAHVGLGKKPPKIIRKSIFLVFERLNDSTNIANPPPSHFKMDDASLLDKSGLHYQG